MSTYKAAGIGSQQRAQQKTLEFANVNVAKDRTMRQAIAEQFLSPDVFPSTHNTFPFKRSPSGPRQ
jgi:hypothetical protein